MHIMSDTLLQLNVCPSLCIWIDLYFTYVVDGCVITILEPWSKHCYTFSVVDHKQLLGINARCLLNCSETSLNLRLPKMIMLNPTIMKILPCTLSCVVPDPYDWLSFVEHEDILKNVDDQRVLALINFQFMDKNYNGSHWETSLWLPLFFKISPCSTEEEKKKDLE